MKLIILADAHLKGIDDSDQKKLVEFLDSLSGIDTLILLGDIFDFWTGCFKGYVYPQYLPTLDALKRLSGRGIKIIYLEGNHDFSMGAFFKDNLKAEVYPNFFEGTIDGKKIYLAHGDAIAGGFFHGLWRAFLRSGFLSLVMRIAGPRFVWNVAMSMSTTSRAHSRGYDAIEAKLKEFAKSRLRDGADAVVLGHSHVAGVNVETIGKRTAIYANPGSWASEQSYLLYENGSFRVKRYKKLSD